MLFRVFIILVALVSGVFADDFFAPTIGSVEASPSECVYPQGSIFPFSYFCVGKSDISLEQYARDGFTMIGPQYELNEKSPQDASKVGLKVIYSIGSDRNGKNWVNFLADSPPVFDPNEIAERVKSQVSAVANDPSIAWWYLEPEELRYWRDNEMLYLKTVSEAIRQNDPKHRPIWMYEPNHRNADALAILLKYYDISGKGAYTNYAGQRDSRIWVRWTVEQEMEAVKKCGLNGRFAILVPEMFMQPAPGYESMIPTWVRHDIYLGLVCGAKGVVVYSMEPRQGFEAYRAYYDAYADVAQQLTGPKGLGQVFLFGQRRSDLHVTVEDGPEHILQKDDFGARLGKPIEYSSITWLETAYGNARYLIMVNSANAPVKVRISGLPRVAIMQQDAFQPTDRKDLTSGTFLTLLKPLEVKGWRFSIESDRRQ